MKLSSPSLGQKAFGRKRSLELGLRLSLSRPLRLALLIDRKEINRIQHIGGKLPEIVVSAMT